MSQRSNYTYEDHPCCDCDKRIRVWLWKGLFSHIGGEGPNATRLDDGPYICSSCNHERWKIRVNMAHIDRLVNG